MPTTQMVRKFKLWNGVDCELHCLPGVSCGEANTCPLRFYQDHRSKGRKGLLPSLWWMWWETGNRKHCCSHLFSVQQLRGWLTTYQKASRSGTNKQLFWPLLRRCIQMLRTKDWKYRKVICKWKMMPSILIWLLRN